MIIGSCNSSDVREDGKTSARCAQHLELTNLYINLTHDSQFPLSIDDCVCLCKYRGGNTMLYCWFTLRRFPKVLPALRDVLGSTKYRAGLGCPLRLISCSLLTANCAGEPNNGN